MTTKKQEKKKKIIITGGHMTPALAVSDILIASDEWEIFFLGRKYASEREKTLSAEYRVVTKRGIWFLPLTAGRFPRLLNRYAFFSALKIPLGFVQALYYLLKVRPRVILSFGGYLSVPVVFWSWVLRIPVLTHEQTTIKGLATKINSIFARKIAVSWKQTVKDYPENKVILTGNPVRNNIFKVSNKYLKILNFDQDLPLIFITGGNQGAHALNLAIGEILPDLLKIANVFHQTGHLKKFGDYENLMVSRRNLPKKLKKRYHLKKYLLEEEMGTFLNSADLLVARSGANNVTEIAALGKPALFVPLPWNYRNEQYSNAMMLKKIGLAEIVIQKGFDLSSQDLYSTIAMMLKNINQYCQKGALAQGLVKKDAAQEIVKELEKMA